MEQDFKYRSNVLPKHESARDIIDHANGVKKEVEAALKRYKAALIKLEVETVGIDTDERVIVDAEKFSSIIDAYKEFESQIAIISKDMKLLRQRYDSHSLEKTDDYLKILLLEQSIQELIADFESSTIPDNVDMV